MMSSLPLAACIGASAVFAGVPIGALSFEGCDTGFTAGFTAGFAAGFCVTPGDAAVLLGF